MNTTDLFNYYDAAQQIGVSRQTIYDWIKRGDIVPVVISNKKFVSREDIERLKKQRSAG